MIMSFHGSDGSFQGCMSVGRQPSSVKTRRWWLDQFISPLVQIIQKVRLRFRIKQQRTKSNFDGSNIFSPLI